VHKIVQMKKKKKERERENTGTVYTTTHTPRVAHWGCTKKGRM